MKNKKMQNLKLTDLHLSKNEKIFFGFIKPKVSKPRNISKKK